ncbi:MAG: N-acetyl-gamma-glutamyl-phosphate reductase [Methylocystaceae bacterium]
MVKVGIVGDGYTAVELVRILKGHPEVAVTAVTSIEHVGHYLHDIYPALMGYYTQPLIKTELDILQQECEVVFLALPHGQSMAMVPELLQAGIKCIDLGADFRLKDAIAYRSFYEHEHQAPELLAEAVYGIPELNREFIRGARLVANPGCYPTGAIMALTPLLRAGLLEPQRLIVDSKSGVSGAGRGLKTSSLFCEINEGVGPYGVGTHRHRPEMIQECSAAAGEPVNLMFTPHLVPMNRGILTTAYGWLRSGTIAEIGEAYRDIYSNEHFINLLPPGVYPHTKRVYGSNRVEIGWWLDASSGQVVMMSAIDNLCRGASGQAVQNLNLMCGLPETMGIDLPPVWP